MAETGIDTDSGGGEPVQRLGGFGHALVQTCAVLLTLGAIAWAADLYRAVGLVLYNEQFYAAMLGIALPLAYLKFPLVKGRPGPVPIYDMVTALVAFAACGYVAWVYPRFANEMADEPLDALIVSAAILILIVEGLRRSVGNVLVILLMAFLAYAMWGHHIPGRLVGRELDMSTIVIQIALDPQSLLGIPMKIATTIVIAFVFLGHVHGCSG